jgi:hypothetical protein
MGNTYSSYRRDENYIEHFSHKVLTRPNHRWEVNIKLDFGNITV